MGKRCSQRQRIGASGAPDQDAFDGRQVCQRLPNGPSYDRHRCGDHVDNARVDGGKVDMITGKGGTTRGPAAPRRPGR